MINQLAECVMNDNVLLMSIAVDADELIKHIFFCD